MAMRNPIPSVLGSASKITGRVQGEGELRIEGSIHGGAAVTGACEITETGSVEGDIEAESLTISGSLQGDATTQGKVVVHSAGAARGTVRCERVVIEPGARVALKVESDFELETKAPPRR